MSKQISHEHLAAFTQMLSREAEFARMNTRELQVIGCLVAHDSPLPIGTVATLLAISAPTMSRLAIRLEEKGMLTRNRQMSDHRLTMLEVTEAGRRVDTKVRQHYITAGQRARRHA